MKNKNFRKFIKSRALSKITILILAMIFILGTFATAHASPINEKNLVNLLNISRGENNLKPLESSDILYQAALDKANDMLENDYFEHYTPSGRSPWDFIHSVGYQYLSAGENLAMDFVTAEGIHKAWMDSPLHRKNILNPGYSQIGIATVTGYFLDHETTMVVQMFANPQNKNSLGTNWTSKISLWFWQNIFPQFSL